MGESDKDFDATMTITVNGQPREVRRGSTLADLLREATVTPTYVVVQMDGVIVAREIFEQTVLQAGNKLELVTLVGGG